MMNGDFLTIFHGLELTIDDIVRILGYHHFVLLASKDVVTPKDYTYYLEQMKGRKMPNSNCCPAYFAIGSIGCHPYMPSYLLYGVKCIPTGKYCIERQVIMRAFVIWD